MEAIRTETIRRNEETGLPTTGNDIADAVIATVGAVAVVFAIKKLILKR